MKKVLIGVGYILSAIILLGTIGLAGIVIFKPHLLNIFIEYVRGYVVILGWWNYLLVGSIGFVESIPFLNMAIPGQTFVVIISGFLAQFNFWGTVMVVVFASTIGDMVAFFLGEYKGKSILRLYGPTFGLGDEGVEKIKKLIKKMGHWAVFVSKRVSYTRGILPFVAGTMRMNIWEFMLYNMLGSLTYGIIIVRLAQLFVGNYQRVVPYMRWIGIGLSLLVLIWYFMKYGRESHKTR